MLFASIVLNILLACAIAEDIVVQTSQGALKGKIEKSREGNDIFVYYGIPYAEPPIGKLRLKPPIEAKPWNGTRDATKKPSPCVQPGLGQEDCLYLNVFTPKLPSNKSETTNKLPVMIFIHGGGFQCGEGAALSGNYLADKSIVYVNLNYRLGSLGFLGMGTDEFSGNFGLKDQSLAFLWVKNNIDAFGGDARDVTIFGQSAGASSVHHHAFNPLSKGLYQKGIMQSGTAVAAWSYYSRPRARAVTTAFSVVTGCFHEHEQKMVECLQKLDVEEFGKAEQRLLVWRSDPLALFKPIIEGEQVSGAALPKKPGPNSYQSSNIPAIIGVNSGDGYFKVKTLLEEEGIQLNEIGKNYRRLLPLVTQLVFTVDPDKCDRVADAVKNYYFGSKHIGNETDVQMLKLLTDILFVVPAIQTLRTYPGKIYAYVYDHKINCSGGYGCYDDEYGVTHGDELPLLFLDTKLPSDQMSPTEKRISALLVELWTNFAKYGDPNGNKTSTLWTPATPTGLEFCHITTNETVMQKGTFKESFQFWSTLLAENEIKP